MFLHGHKHIRPFPVVLNVIALVIAIISESRSFIIGYTASLVFIFLLYRNFILSKRAIYGLLVLMAGILAILVFFFKSDSSQGRLLIYKISFRVLKDHFFSGIGWGQFKVVYNQYQAGYFQSGPYTMKELLLADNVQYAFNDYLQFVIETGITGWLFLIVGTAAILMLMVKTCRKYSPIHFPVLLSIAFMQVIAIGIAALFRYVYSQFFISVVFVSGLAIIVKYYLDTPWPWLKAITLLVLAIFCIGWYHYGYYIRNHQHFKTYEAAKALYGAGYINDALQMYKLVYPRLRQHVLFTGDYAAILISTGDYKAAVKELERLRNKTCHTILYTQLGDCYYRERRWKEAEQAYMQAVYMVPKRFLPRYHLFDFYIKTRQLNKASWAGKELLAIPVKVPSEQVTNIKIRVRSAMNDIN